MSVEHLEHAITLWAEEWNRNPTRFRWAAKPDGILASVERAHQALTNTHIDSVSDH